MRIVRVVLPAFAGLLVLLFGITTVAPGLQSGDPGELAASFQVAVLPFGIGIVLLLAAASAVRRTRLGYLLGLAVGLLMTAAGPATIAAQVEYLDKGGLGGSLAVGIIGFAVVWTIVWLSYSWRFGKSKPDFAPTWTSADRRLAAVVVVVVVLAAASFVALSALQTNIANSL